VRGPFQRTIGRPRGPHSSANHPALADRVSKCRTTPPRRGRRGCRQTAICSGPNGQNFVAPSRAFARSVLIFLPRHGRCDEPRIKNVPDDISSRSAFANPRDSEEVPHARQRPSFGIRKAEGIRGPATKVGVTVGERAILSTRNVCRLAMPH